MKIAVVGVRAVGGYCGGRMVEHGLDVTFLARVPTVNSVHRENIEVIVECRARPTRPSSGQHFSTDGAAAEPRRAHQARRGL